MLHFAGLEAQRIGPPVPAHVLAGCCDLCFYCAQDPVESRMAPLIKREMDKLYSPTWHVFIGKDFGANVTHENKSTSASAMPSKLSTAASSPASATTKAK